MASKSSKGQKKTRTGKTSTQKKKTTIQVEKKGDDLSKDIILWTVLAVSISAVRQQPRGWRRWLGTLSAVSSSVFSD